MTAPSLPTITPVNKNFNRHKGTITTLVLLCIGYFIDFYDLTIFSSSYPNVIVDLFHITDQHQIQLTYLKTMNVYTLGILTGSIFFGVLGDKFGRSFVIKFTILLYSITTLASIVAHSLPIFMALRFLAGAGLAVEFATSAVLINEIFPKTRVPKYTAYLYFCGILGGISSTLLTIISWQFMFLIGGLLGLVLYISRSKLLESPLFLNLTPGTSKGSIWLLFNSISNLKKLFRLVLLIAPYNFLIAIMFIFPSFMQLNTDLNQAIKILLIGFFIGNLVSTIGCSYIVSYFKSYRLYLLFNTLAFIVILCTFILISSHWFIVYSVLLGLLGGGLPTVWIQVVAKSFGINQRNTASNIVYAGGRCFTIFCNLIISYFIVSPHLFFSFAVIATLLIGGLSLAALKFTPANFAGKINYLE